MVPRAQAARLPIRWVVADTVYGHCPDLRLFLEKQGYAYALAVPSTEVVCVQTRTGLLLSDVASIAQQALRAQEWQRLSQSLGTKGERLFDWARLPVVQAGVADGRHWLLVRRCLDNPNELAYSLGGAPISIGLAIIIVAVARKPGKPLCRATWPSQNFSGEFSWEIPGTFSGKTPRRSSG